MIYVVIWLVDKEVEAQGEFKTASKAVDCFCKFTKAAGIPMDGRPKGLSKGRNLMNAAGKHAIYAFSLEER